MPAVNYWLLRIMERLIKLEQDQMGLDNTKRTIQAFPNFFKRESSPNNNSISSSVHVQNRIFKSTNISGWHLQTLVEASRGDQPHKPPCMDMDLDAAARSCDDVVFPEQGTLRCDWIYVFRDNALPIVGHIFSPKQNITSEMITGTPKKSWKLSCEKRGTARESRLEELKLWAT